MPTTASRRNSNDLVLFSSSDGRPVMSWLCESHGLQAIMRAVSRFTPSGPTPEAPTKRRHKRRGRKPDRLKNAADKAGGIKGTVT